jgi:GTPase Era involved in 16S rRNA processing
MIKRIGEESRFDIGLIANTKVHLFLFVKVQDNWMNKVDNFDRIDIEKIPLNKK